MMFVSLDCFWGLVVSSLGYLKECKRKRFHQYSYQNYHLPLLKVWSFKMKKMKIEGFLGFSLEVFSQNFVRVSVCEMQSEEMMKDCLLFIDFKKATTLNAFTRHYCTCLEY